MISVLLSCAETSPLALGLVALVLITVMFLLSRSQRIDLTSATCIAADLLKGQSTVSEIPRSCLP